MTTQQQDFSPLVHAIGGSLGSALALLLLYPLERARIELQATVAAAAATDAETDEETKDDAVVEKTTETTISGNDDAAEERKSSSPLEHPPSTLAGADPLKSPPPPPRTTVSPSHSSVGESESSSWTDAKAFLEEVEAPPPPPPSSRSTTAAPFQSPGIPTMQQPPTNKKQHESGSRSSSKRRRRKQPRGRKMSVLQCLWSVCQKGELYRGAGPIVLTLATSNFVFFWIQSYLRQKQLSQHVLLRRRRNNKSLDSLLASTLGGILNVLLTNPLWVANLRIVTKQASSDTLWGELAHLVQTSSSATELVSRLWQGTGSSLLLVSNPVLQFVCYEQVRCLLLSGSSRALSPAAAFGTGAASKALSTLVTYPLQLSQAVMRLQQKRQGKQKKKTRKEDDGDEDDDDETSGYRNTYDCLRQLYLRDGGYRGWYTGLRAKLLQTVLTAAFTFLTYEQILGAVHAVLVAQQEQRRRQKTAILVS